MQRTQNPVSSAPVEPTPAGQPTGPCPSDLCIASFCDGLHHVDVTGFIWTEAPSGNPPCQIIAVWAVEEDEPANAVVFTPDEYAEWAEMNNLTDAYASPARFYGTIPAGHLVDLDHTTECGEYDENDYATVTHTWTYASNDDTYATGVARRDGRA